MRRLFILLVVGLCFLSTLGEATAKGGSNDESALCRCDQVYRGIGVNYFDGIYRRIRQPMDQSYIQGLDILQDYKIPFVRVNFSGHWPLEFQRYVKQPEIYFKIVDDFVAACEARGIGIIASVNWNYAAIPDSVGEPMSAWGKDDSKTAKLAARLLEDLVKRYKGRQVIWAWEFGNELMLRADLPNAEKLRPAIDAAKGTPASRGPADDLRSQDVLAAFSRFAKGVRVIDSDVLLSTGNAAPRPFAFHNSHKRSWDEDTESQYCDILQRDNPSAFDLPSVHIYPDAKGYFRRKGSGYGEVLDASVACMKAAKRPLLLGEFGVGRDRGRDEEAEKVAFKKVLDKVESSGVDLAAVWVFDFPYQRGSYSIYKGEREYQLQMIMDANVRLQNSLKFKSSCGIRPRRCDAAVGRGGAK